MDVIRVAADDEATRHLQRGSYVREVSVRLVSLVRNTQLTSSIIGTVKQVDKCRPLRGSNPLLATLSPPYIVAQAGLHTYRISSGFDYRKYLGSISIFCLIYYKCYAGRGGIAPLNV
jgi:hypothetical protein